MDVARRDNSVTHSNHLLASLPATDFALLRPHLKSVDLIHEDVLFEAGDPVKRVYLPHSGVISLVVDLADGQMIEAAMIGRDSIVGGSSALDGKVSLNKGIVQIPGTASTLDVGRLREFAEQSLAFRTHVFDMSKCYSPRRNSRLHAMRRIRWKRDWLAGCCGPETSPLATHCR